MISALWCPRPIVPTRRNADSGQSRTDGRGQRDSEGSASERTDAAADAGAAVARHTKHPDVAIKFMEYLASPSAQQYFANGNNEWPVAKGVTTNNTALKSMTGGGTFKYETIPISAVGGNQVKVQQMLDRVGFK